MKRASVRRARRRTVRPKGAASKARHDAGGRGFGLAVTWPEAQGVRVGYSGLFLDCGVLQPVSHGGKVGGLVQNGATLTPALTPRLPGAVRVRKPRRGLRSRGRAAGKRTADRR